MTDLQREAKEIADFSELLGFDEYQVCKDAIAILRRIERGELVEVVRCGECVKTIKKNKRGEPLCDICRMFGFESDDFCSYGRRPNENP